MDEQQTQPNNQELTENPTGWLDKEAQRLNQALPEGERLDSLKLEENKIATVEVDFANQFGEWVDAENNTVKAIIPVTHEGTRKNWWLNKKNPVYSAIIRQGREGKSTFKVLQTGTQKNTRYTLVED